MIEQVGRVLLLEVGCYVGAHYVQPRGKAADSDVGNLRELTYHPKPLVATDNKLERSGFVCYSAVYNISWGTPYEKKLKRPVNSTIIITTRHSFFTPSSGEKHFRGGAATVGDTELPEV